MKKLTSLLVVVALALGMMAFAGCWFEAQSISFVEAPATTYTLGENVLDFTIRVNEGGATKDYRYSDYKGLISVSGFSTDTVGSRRATVTYNNQFSLRFDYTVVNDKFAGGTGSEFDPYLVSTAGQFQNLLDATSFKYYKLTKSIDFYNYPLRMANDAKNATPDDVWAGNIDGAGYTLMNLNTLLKPDGTMANKYLYMFGRVASAAKGSFVLKNITMEFAGEGSSAIIGTAFANGDGAEILFENVNFTGYISGKSTSDSGVSPVIGIPGKLFDKPVANGSANYKSITFKNCTNDVNIMDTFGAYAVAGYFGGNNGWSNGTVTFDNCSFNGTIDGAGTLCGAFVAQNKPSVPTGHTGVGVPEFQFINCTIGSDAVINAISGKANGINEIYSGSTAKLEEVTEGITNNADQLFNTLPSITVTASGTTLTVGTAAASYKFFVAGSFASGTFRCPHPVVPNGNGGYTLYKFTSNLTVDPASNDVDYGFGSTRLVLNNGIVTYNAQGVNPSPTAKLELKEAIIYVLAYDAYGNLIGCGYSGKVNLNA